jgi:hypothetical protein
MILWQNNFLSMLGGKIILPPNHSVKYLRADKWLATNERKATN